MKRYKESRRTRNKKFGKTAGREHRANFNTPIMRGGTRL